MATLFSCENKFPRFAEKEDGVYMQLLSFETHSERIAATKYASISLDFYDKDNLIYKHFKEDLIDLDNNAYSFITNHISVGDSCKFMIPTKKTATILHPLKLNTSAEYLAVFVKFHATHKEERDPEMIEQVILKNHINHINAKPLNGIYIKNSVEGTGKKIAQGDVITIRYTGSFLSGLVFDTATLKDPFTFIYGTQGQVIKGLEIAIKSMREGQKSKIIIPSQLAFGEEGSSTLIVAPHTTVVYDLEIINVK